MIVPALLCLLRLVGQFVSGHLFIGRLPAPDAVGVVDEASLARVRGRLDRGILGQVGRIEAVQRVSIVDVVLGVFGLRYVDALAPAEEVGLIVARCRGAGVLEPASSATARCRID